MLLISDQSPLQLLLAHESIWCSLGCFNSENSRVVGGCVKNVLLQPKQGCQTHQVLESYLQPITERLLPYDDLFYSMNDTHVSVTWTIICQICYVIHPLPVQMHLLFQRMYCLGLAQFLCNKQFEFLVTIFFFTVYCQKDSQNNPLRAKVCSSSSSVKDICRRLYSLQIHYALGLSWGSTYVGLTQNHR